MKPALNQAIFHPTCRPPARRDNHPILGNLKTGAILQPARIRWSRRTAANPIRGLTFEKLARQLESFVLGYLSDAALTWETMERRDALLGAVAAKRKKAVARWTWEIQTLDDSPAAAQHKERLEAFYNNLVATNAFDENGYGGVSLLIRQMLDCVGKRYSAHEIVWKPDVGAGFIPARPAGRDGINPSPTQNGLTAEFRFVPLWFFENTTGRLRFLQTAGALEGVPLNAGEWLICAGDGLMEASSILYLFKHAPLKDWLIYSERHGMPGIRGKTNAPKDSPQWEAMLEAIQNFAAEFAAVMSADETIEAIDLSTKGDLPYPKLIEYCDRAMSALWRGADLSTLSSGPESTGASVQGKETELLEHDDAALVAETLQQQVDRYVIEYAFGAGVKPLAYFQLVPPVNLDAQKEIVIDQGLANLGLPIAAKDLYARYGRRQPEAGDELVTPRAPAAPNPFGNARIIANAALSIDAKTPRLLAAAREELGRAQARALLPLRERLAEIETIANANDQQEALRRFQRDLPALLKKINAAPATAQVLEKTLGAALLNGMATQKTESPA
ncbi:MAG: DUF935 family protein [Verrucomicrobia bacterium]|nr:DUF935 family protein [Verrucomicrobiota bacterium]